MPLRLSVGAGGGATATVTERVMLPPAPVQLRVNVRSLVRALKLWLPLVLFDPDQAPDAVQLVTLLDVQLTLVLP